MKSIGVALFCYRRVPDILGITDLLIETGFDVSQLNLFCDGPINNEDRDDVLTVQRAINDLALNKKFQVIMRKENLGLYNNIRSGVSDVLSKYDSVIVLEDDILPTIYFFQFMIHCLNNEKKCSTYGISGYTPYIGNSEGIFHFDRIYPWGWGTWKSEWQSYLSFNPRENISFYRLFNFALSCGQDAPHMLLRSLSGVRKSWYIEFVFWAFINRKKALFYGISLVENLGFGDGKATNTESTSVTYKSIVKSQGFMKLEYLSESVKKKMLAYWSYWAKLMIRIR